MRFDLVDGFCLSPIRDGDQTAYLQHFQDKALTDALILIPYPYTRQDADQWIKVRVEATAKQARESQFALRRPDGFLVGGAGLVLTRGMKSHRADLGYWIIAEYRGRGLVRAAVRALVRHGFSELGLKRIQAWTTLSNEVSQRILEKEGFAREGLLRGYQQSEGVLLDGYLYARLSDGTEKLAVA